MTVEKYLKGQVLLIDKPFKWSSFQTVNKIRWQLKKKFNLKKIKVGHAGTLDPLATGLLVVCTGKGTKNITTYQNQPKEYTGTLFLGQTTPSYDLETQVNQTFATDHITSRLIRKVSQQFVGEINQKPPIFSALKKKGKRFYELARRGEAIQIASRKVTITEFEISEIAFPRVHFRVVCSKGTYIRSLAHDFGQTLSSGAYLSSLKRTRVGDFSLKNALSIHNFIQQLEAE